MYDKVMTGAISGMTGSLVQFIFGVFAKMIGLTDRYVFMFIFGRLCK